MPHYDFRCPGCSSECTLRRRISEFGAPVQCGSCGSTLDPLFRPSPNIQVPMAFRQLLTGGAPGGGGLSWSDFHDKTERELAHTPGVEKQSTWESQRHARPDTTRQDMERAYVEAKQLVGAQE